MFVERGFEAHHFEPRESFPPRGRAAGVFTEVSAAGDWAGHTAGGCGGEAGSARLCLPWGSGWGRAEEAKLWSRHVQKITPG